MSADAGRGQPRGRFRRWTRRRQDRTGSVGGSAGVVGAGKREDAGGGDGFPRAEIGRRLAELRTDVAVPIEDLAAAAGMSVGQYREVEAGGPVETLDVETLWTLAELLGTTPHKLLDGLDGLDGLGPGTSTRGGGKNQQ